MTLTAGCPTEEALYDYPFNDGQGRRAWNWGKNCRMGNCSNDRLLDNSTMKTLQAIWDFLEAWGQYKAKIALKNGYGLY